MEGTPRKKLVGKQQQRRPLSKEHVAKLLELELDQDVYVLLLLGLCAGMRMKDAALLKTRSIKGGFITYTPAKTKNTSSARVQVPILSVLQDAIDAIAVEQDQKYLLPRMAEWYQRNRNYLNRNILPIIHSVTGDKKQDSSGKGKIARREYGYHSLRHTFCTECARAGVPATILAAMAGDTIATLDKFYVKLDLSSPPITELASMRSALALATNGHSPEREELKQLIDELPLSKVKELLGTLKS